MQRKKILWLVSWYPNQTDRFDGDFIQRHARAAAIYHDIHVIFITEAELDSACREEWNYATGLTEQVIYFRKTSGFLKKIRKQLLWKTFYQKAIEKYIQKNGKPELVHVHVPWKAGLMALWLKKKHNLPFIVTEHWGIYNDVVEDNFYSKPKWTKDSLKLVFRESVAFTSVSRFLADGVKKITGIKADVIIPNVTDTTLFYHKNEKYSKFTFIHVSNMVPLKNVKGILDAFRELDTQMPGRCQLIMIGNRDDIYPRYSEASGLLNAVVFFRGEISYREVAEEMRRSHCFILNSNMENSPCVIGEALCCGLPVIATRVGGIPELLNDRNSMQVAVGNQDELLKAMKEIFNGYQSYDQKTIAEEAAIKFGYSTIATQFDLLYRDQSEKR
jgi:glycosyltransferase involved in cell wall biosynthesis